jgi:hypothetical protein
MATDRAGSVPAGGTIGSQSATRAFAAGNLVERYPAMVVPAAEHHLLDKNNLFNYYFYREENAVAITLGYGSLYNHSASPVARYRKIYGAETVEHRWGSGRPPRRASGSLRFI